MVFIGCILVAGSFNLFFDAFNISPGGVTGLAMIFNHLTGISVGSWVLLMNLPLAVIAYVRLGRAIIFSTIITVITFSLLVDFTAWLPSPVDDMLLASLCGGALMGLGLGMIFRGGATTGGTAIAGKLLLQYKPHIKLGKIMLGLDGVIIGANAFVFRNFSLAVYAFIGMYIATRIMDTILYGFDFATLTYVVTDKHDEIGNAIKTKLLRGVTYLDATGGYTGDKKKVVFCAIKRGQLTDLRRLVMQADPAAFLIVTEGHQIFGEGFNKGL